MSSAVLAVPIQLRTERAEISGNRIAGLDSLRFVLAIWVCLSHFGPHISGGPALLAGITNNLFNGAAAVIGFFLISGLCIHWPQAAPNARPLNIPAFYARRLTRIAVPLAVALIAGVCINQSLFDFYGAILWSLIAEMFYYAAYPAILALLKAYGFSPVLAAAYCASTTLILTHPAAMNFHQFGPWLTWVAGLPSWLLGCRLAEIIRNRKTSIPDRNTLRNTSRNISKRRSVWLFRGGVWALSVIASILRFHAGIGYPLTLTLLGPVLFFWIKAELTSGTPSNRALDSLGAFSYSVYLTHGLAVTCLLGIAPWAQSNPALPVRLAFIVAFAWVFFLVVEKPSHHLARKAGSFVLSRGSNARRRLHVLDAREWGGEANADRKPMRQPGTPGLLSPSAPRA